MKTPHGHSLAGKRDPRDDEIEEMRKMELDKRARLKKQTLEKVLGSELPTQVPTRDID
jgi:hypothetical protein